MPTLILPPRYTEDSIELWRTAVKEEWNSIRVQGWRLNGLVEDDEITIYGEPLFAAAIAQQLSMVLLEPSFDWLANLPEQFTKRHIAFGYIDGLEDLSYPSFIKPADDKCFPARIYSNHTMVPGLSVLEDDVPVLASEPVEWESEFRCFICEGRCTTMSIYARYGQTAKSEDGTWPISASEKEGAVKFLATVLENPGIHIPPSVVIDIGIIKDRGWAILEANPSWGAGIYGCSPLEVLKTVKRACLPASDVRKSDKEWIIKRKPARDLQ